MRRWTGSVLAAGLLALAGAAGAQPAPVTGVVEKTYPATTLFPYLDKYWGLPAAERTLFAPGYFVREDHGPSRNVHAWLVEGDTRRPIPIEPTGLVGRLPTLAELKADQVAIQRPAEAKASVALKLLSTVRTGSEMNAPELARAIRQADVGGRKAAGMMAPLLPRVVRAVFMDSGAGVAVMAGGSTTPLPGGDRPSYDPVKLPGAQRLRFAHAPSYVKLESAGKEDE